MALAILWRFARPHTIYGTSASVVGLYLLAGLGIPHLLWLGLTLAACLSMNIYIVGLNQLLDIEIDRINKPYLPLPAQDLTPHQGRILVITCGLTGILLSLLQIPYLALTVILSGLIGTAYSLPPLRLKRFPIMAAFCITVVRGWVVNIGLYAAFRTLAEGCRDPTIFSPELLALVAFITLFGLVIAVFKDIPDMEGDRQFQILTFSLQLGSLRVLNGSVALLVAGYGLMGILGSLLLSSVQPVVLALVHLVPAGILLFYRWRLDVKDSNAIMGYYYLIWKLFYLEYLLYALGFVIARG